VQGRGRFVILPGLISKLYFRLKGLAPWIFFAVIDSDVRSVRRARVAPEAMPSAEESALAEETS
jgi:hypothetical protein